MFAFIIRKLVVVVFLVYYSPQAKMSFSTVERNSPPLLKEEIVDLCLEKCVSDHEKYEIEDVLSCVRCNNVEKLSAIIGNMMGFGFKRFTIDDLTITR